MSIKSIEHQVADGFAVAQRRALLDIEREGGIGTLSEKLMHKTLKLYIEPREHLHEVDFLGSVADIKNECGIFEIQTKNFAYLIPKLRKFLPECHVTVVYPVVGHKNILWVDKQTGCISDAHKTTRVGRVSDVLYEVSALTEFIPDDRLTVRVILLTAEEYKSLDGWDKSRKRGASRIDRIPTAIEKIVDLNTISDYISILPPLGEKFTAKELYKALRLKGRRASYSLNFLMRIGAVKRVDKIGKAYIYEMEKE